MALRLWATLAALLPGIALAQDAPSADPYAPGKAILAELGRIVTPNGVQETHEVVLGGAKQVITVRGADRANPILLFVHGDPGAVEMPISWSFQRPWEDFFTVVQWDQRGAGRSYLLNDPATIAPTLTPDRYRDDAIELIEWLNARYGKRKVVLMGHSWGSVVGLSVAQKRPDLLHAYVGVGQLIHFRENERIGFAWTLEQARKTGNAEAVRELEALQPYPGDGDFSVDKVAIERKWSDFYGGLAYGRTDGIFYFRPGRLSPDYRPEDRKAWDDGSAMTMKTMWPKLADIDFTGTKRLKVPTYLFLGRHDYTTPSVIADRWLAALQAPRKGIVWFNHSSHLPMLEEPGHMLAALIKTIRPIAADKDK
ncbi:MAG: alpha/beta hydrolase [Sphingomonadaceae bacterium]|nr:alpha/beta hydrolase [Sphingomonadaceae bacterium]